MVECDGLENRCPFLRTVGSNPTLSAVNEVNEDEGGFEREKGEKR